MKMNWIRLALLASLVTTVPVAITPNAYAQSITAGALTGTLADTTGAAVPNAKVTVTNIATGAVKTTTATDSGSFRIPLLEPGTYKVLVSASGFSDSSNQVYVGVGAVTTDDIKLQIGSSSTTIEVTAAPVAVNTENADITTVLTAQQVQAMPNPGNDLTFVAQIAPGSTMNTGTAAGGYGNFSSFGISGLSNMFTLDGGYENDPFLNLNQTGASNLTLGNNEVDTVTVVSPAYSAQFGGLGGAQTNEITTSGGNRVHGNANYYWSGRALNANDWFNKRSQVYNSQKNQAQFVNANQWSASIGGPILKDRLFWFVNTEGLRVTTPTSGQVYAPNTALQNCSLNGVGCDALNAAADANCSANNFINPSTCVGGQYGYAPFSQAPTSQRPLLTSIYGVFNKSPFRPATGVIQDPNDVSLVSYYAKSASFLSEWLLTGRVDYKISDKDSIYVHYKQDHGIQPTYTDLIDPRFSAQSPQPAWEGQINETHTFSPNLVNQLVIAGNYYSAPFTNTNNYLPVAPFTFVFESGDMLSSAVNYGGDNYAFPQGRRVAGYQIIDDISYTHGKNTVRGGYNFRRDNVTDLPQTRSVAALAEGSFENFSAGTIDFVHSQYFPQRAEQPIAVYNEGFYVTDTFKVSPTLTFTAGVRAEHNSNPTCLTNCFQSLAGEVSALPTGATSASVPYNAAFSNGLISSGRHQTFKGFQSVGIMPRLSVAWQPFGAGKTVVRAGFGMFTDTPPGSIAENLLSNAPGVFHAAVYGATIGGSAANVNLDPNTAGSGGAYARASSAAFQTQFAKGGTFTTTGTAVSAVGGLYSAPSFTTTAATIKYPTYEEFSLAIEQPIDRFSTISVTYVGNHGYHEPVANGGSNLTTTGRAKFGANFFPTVAATKPVTAFATVTNISTSASSNYNGLIVTAQRHSKQFSVQLNYAYSKALDEVSNGGLEPFAPDAGDGTNVENPTNLHQQYGRADYDVRQNTTGLVTWQVPSYHVLPALTGGFEFNAVVFHQTGLPYSITQSTTNIGQPGTTLTSSFSNGGTLLLARQVSNDFDHHCGGGAHASLPDGSTPNPCNFTKSSAFAGPTNFGQQGRNTLTGPAYTNVNFGAFKVIPIYKLESVKLKVGAQFFNLFNHPNFQNPGHTLTGTGTSSYGGISSTVSSPTNIFGSVGANSSPRLVQLKGTLTF